MWVAMRSFGHGPYNPLHYKSHLIPEKLPTTEDFYGNLKTMHTEPPQPIYNMRHLHPVRQSGPIPPYDGAWTMEDVKKICSNMSVPYDHCPQSTDVEELMRRAPGLTRKEALRIQQLGLNPDEEVDFAYMTVNMGLDVFYERNQAYLARQVVTNSKGEKVEILWPCATYDEMTNMVFGTAEVWEYHENPWDPIPGELPIRIQPDYDLGVPYSWFEYEMDNKIHSAITQDQQYIPEDERPFPIDKNPHSHKYIWRPQEDMKNDDVMRDPDWYPTEKTQENIYNRRDFKKEENFMKEY
jgi:hypothetical protein